MRTIRYKISNQEEKAVIKFINDLNTSAPGAAQLTLEQVAKQSLFLAINEAYHRAKELMDAENSAQETADAAQSTGSEVAQDPQSSDTDGSGTAS